MANRLDEGSISARPAGILRPRNAFGDTPGPDRRTAMLDDVIKDLRASCDKAIEALRRDLAKVRTGRAHPTMLDGIRVDYYGTQTPLGQMATIAVPEPRLLTVKPWDKGQVKAVDKAIREGDL